MSGALFCVGTVSLGLLSRTAVLFMSSCISSRNLPFSLITVSRIPEISPRSCLRKSTTTGYFFCIVLLPPSESEDRWLFGAMRLILGEPSSSTLDDFVWSMSRRSTTCEAALFSNSSISRNWSRRDFRQCSSFSFWRGRSRGLLGGLSRRAVCTNMLSRVG